MKAKRRANAASNPKVGSQSPTREQKSVLDEFDEYYAMKQAAHAVSPSPEDIFVSAVRTINHFADADISFAEKTPRMFKTNHWSYAAGLADVAARHLIQLAQLGNEDALRMLADLTVELTETLTELLRSESGELDKNAQIMSRTATQLPYWPVLYFRNTAANNHLPLTADKLKLGKECPINVSDSANYTMGSPINWFVWKCLRHFQRVHWAIKDGFKRPGFGHPEKPAKSFEEAVEGIVIRTTNRVTIRPAGVGRPAGVIGMIYREELPIYKASYALLPLTKSTAKEWAEKAIWPFVRSRYPDFSKVPQFADILKRPDADTPGRQRREIRKDIVRSLTALARKG